MGATARGATAILATKVRDIVLNREGASPIRYHDNRWRRIAPRLVDGQHRLARPVIVN